jgi:1-acyl-sn-glycerol-3-phosphate acyltransferase
MSEFDLNPEPFIKRWGRRTLSISALLLMASLYMAFLPLALCVAVGVDLYRKRGIIVARTVLFFGYYFVIYLGALSATLVQWVLAGTWTRGRAGDAHARLARWSQWLGALWGRWLYHGASSFFRTSTEVEGAEVLASGPYIMFLRHVSVGDTVIPYTFASSLYGVHFRHVLKTELLNDPCMDIAGHRWKNVFVRRGSGDSEKEIALLRKAVTGLANNEGVAIWPEGTRFTPEKREQILASVARKSPEIYRDASALKNVLPPHLGGPLGLLEANERADAVFCAHTGLDATQHIRSFFNGSVIGDTVRIKFWRIPYRDIPQGREERIKWFFHWWKVVDAWIGEVKG